MHATHPHPRRALVAALAVLALALPALMSATRGDMSFSLGGTERSAPAPPSIGLDPARAAPAWSENPFSWPLLQVPRR